jgi:5-methylcytosine-specific restriction endonuclease McrA
MAKKCSIEGCNNPSFCNDYVNKKSYCSIHRHLREDKKYKGVNKVTEKQKVKIQEKKEYTKTQFEMFLEIWEEKEHYCESCECYLGDEPLSVFFDHLIEKSKRKDLALEKENIFLCCLQCHSSKTNGYPTEKHKQAIIKAIKQFNIL